MHEEESSSDFLAVTAVSSVSAAAVLSMFVHLLSPSVPPLPHPPPPLDFFSWIISSVYLFILLPPLRPPPLFLCVSVHVCAAVVFRRCVQLICAASLLPPTPSLCKYLSPLSLGA